MHFLIVNTVYPEALAWLYGQHAGLGEASYADQIATFEQELPGATGFYARNLRKHGHTAEMVIANNALAQRAWAVEHGLGHLASRGTFDRVRHRVVRRLVPRIAQRSQRQEPWTEILAAQVRAERPDVLVNLSVDGIPARVMGEVKPSVGLLIGEGDAALPLDCDYGCYDLLRCSLPSHVEHFQRLGQACVLYRFGFEPDILERVPAAPAAERPVPVAWVGSLTRMHTNRVAMLEALAREVRLDVWAPSIDHLPADSAIRRAYRGQAWGFDNYRVLARTAITVNMQIDTADDYADNIRLYESTGLGALLITDAKRNLADLFRTGEEVVAYTDPGECVRLVKHFMEHPAERAALGAAGQARTLREHTYYLRMQDLVGQVRECGARRAVERKGHGGG